jgi:hypothetical protein
MSRTPSSSYCNLAAPDGGDHKVLSYAWRSEPQGPTEPRESAILSRIGASRLNPAHTRNLIRVDETVPGTSQDGLSRAPTDWPLMRGSW